MVLESTSGNGQNAVSTIVCSFSNTHSAKIKKSLYKKHLKYCFKHVKDNWSVKGYHEFSNIYLLLLNMLNMFYRVPFPEPSSARALYK